MKQKVITVGPSGIGKTALINALCDKFYTESKVSTTQADIRTSDSIYEGRPVTNLFWDTAGQERYDSLTQIYLQDANVVLLLVSPEEPSLIQKYYKLITDSLPSNSYKLIIVFSKMDMYNLSQSGLQQAINEANSYNPYDVIPTSSLNMYNIDYLENRINSCAFVMQEEQVQQQQQIHVEMEKQTTQSGCFC